MSISLEQVKELRTETGISIAQCKKALEDAGGDMEQARNLLRERGAEIAIKKGDREFGAGTVSTYIHAGGNVASMVELVCETDFVSQNADFKELASDLSMHVAAMAPADREEFLEQDFIKDPSMKISALVLSATQKFGERVDIGRIARFAIGE